MAIADARSPSDLEILESVREPVRLGHRVFTAGRFSRMTLDDAARAFRRFRRLMDRYGVRQYRAVATSAARESRNRDALLRRVRRTSGIALEVIESAEEARFVRLAILRAAGEKIAPRWIIDLGGGSLEISLLRNRRLIEGLALPLGSVRLMETLRLRGALTQEQCEAVEHRVFSLLQSLCPTVKNITGAIAAAAGGNAEALARISPGPALNGIPSINLRLLRERLWTILSLDIEERMEEFGIRRDRAEVLGAAAIVFASLSRYLNLRTMLVPGVGVKEGLLWDLAAAHFAALSPDAYAARFQSLMREARRLASRFHCDLAHGAQVRKSVVELFHRFSSIHGFPNHLRLPLEIAASLREAGRAISASSSSKHGEYIVRHAEIAGLPKLEQRIAACLVRYQGDTDPDPSHKLYSSLSAREQRYVRGLAGILRIAIALNCGRRSAVRALSVETKRKRVRVRVYPVAGKALPVSALRQSAKLFEKVFECRVSFGRLRRERPPNRAVPGSGRGAEL